MAKNFVGAFRFSLAVTVLLACAACGGGDDSGPLVARNATAGGQIGPVLRACEAPEAPCPASQAQGGLRK